MKRSVWLCLLLLLVALSARAQNPPSVSFTASSDHNVLVGTTPVLDGYQLDVMKETASGALAFTRTLGKPTPDASNQIVVPVPEFLTQGNGLYVATVSATGPGGTARSVPADPFAWVSQPPALPGKPSVISPAP